MEDYEKLLEGVNSEEDNAYNIIQKKEEVKIKKILYKSIHDPNTLPSYSTFNLKGKRYVVSNLSGSSVKKVEKQKKIILGDEPQERKILKKQEKNPMISSLNEIKKKNPELLMVKKKKKKYKAPVPDINDIPIMNLTADVDYINDNAVQIINTKPPVRKKKVGKKLIDEDPLKKEDYGKVSSYLINIKKELEKKENVKKQDVIDEEKIAQEIEEKRNHLLTELKNKYDDINKEYMKISHVVDVNSIRKLKKKEKYEKELNELEKDIQKLEVQR